VNFNRITATTKAYVDSKQIIFNVKDYGAVGNGTTDDTAAINAAVTAAQNAGGGIVWIPSRHAISGRVIIPNQVSLQGAGNGLQFPPARLICTTATAGVTTTGTGDGGLFTGFTVDGNNIATNPMLCTGLNAQRTFVAVDVIAAAQDNWIIEICQNYSFVSCSTQLAGRDNVVLRNSTGGHLFTRFEGNNATRYNLLIVQDNPASDYDTLGYFTPQHIRFEHSLFERATGDNPSVKINHADNVTFSSAVFHAAATGMVSPIFDLAGGTLVNLETPIFSGISSQVAAMRVAANAGLSIQGRTVVIGPAAALDVAANGVVELATVPALGGGTVMFTAGTDRNVSVLRTDRGKHLYRKQIPSDVVFDVLVDGEAGARMRLTADGVLQIGSGADYTFGTALYRRGDGDWGTTGGMVVGGPFSANAAVPRTPHTLGVAATDLATAITLINNIRTTLINNGIGQA